MNDELLMKAQTLQKESEQIENNLNIINEHVKDLTAFNENLIFLEKDKEKEILASLGRGVYVKSRIEDDKELFVEVGAGVVVKKTPNETKKIIEGQIKKFEEARLQMKMQLELYAAEFRKMVKEINKIKEDIGED